MKYILIVISFCSAMSASAQSPNQKISRDSVKYYQRELNTLWRTTYDSLKNSERYKFLVNRLDPKNRQKVVTFELLGNMGLYFNDFKNLNSRLKSLGQEEVKPMAPSVGVSLAIGFPKIIYGIEGSAYVFDNSTASFKGMHLRFFIGTNLFKKSPIVLNPQIGYSGSYMNLFIHKSSSQVEFDDLVTSQENVVHLKHIQDYIDFTLGLKLGSPKKPDFYWQFLRVGYRYGVKEVPWTKRGGDIINAPIDRNNQFYIQLCLGFDRP